MVVMSEQIFIVLFVGAGEINFGSAEGPWNHSRRLERLLRGRLRVVGLIDPDIRRAEKRILQKQSDPDIECPIVEAWRDTKTFSDIPSAASSLGGIPISLVVNGCPPQYRGTNLPGQDVELQILKHFPQARAMLIEKPITSSDPAQTDLASTATELGQWAHEKQAVVSVGYMLRYLRPVAKIRSILTQHGLTPMCISARYFMAYPLAVKLQWWDKDQIGGPVVEQATHFVDLIRFLAGSHQGNEVLSDTVQATTVEWDEEAGVLGAQGFDEDLIEEKLRIPRLTNAFWKHEKGTVGTLTHGIALHGDTYDTCIEVLADGWRLALRDAYSSCPTLTIRSPETNSDITIEYPDEDPFATEFEAIVKAVDAGGTSSSGDPTSPLSDWSDALRTYELTWAIRRAGEETSKGRAQPILS